MAASRKKPIRKRAKKPRPTLEQVKALTSAAYRSGLEHGKLSACSHCQSKKLRLLAIANANLWEILTELDRTDPVAGVVISMQQADIIIKALRRGERHLKYANLLAAQVRDCDRTFDLLRRQLLDPEERPDH